MDVTAKVDVLPQPISTPPPTLAVMTFNVRVANWLDHLNPWRRHKGAIEAVLKLHGPDVAGLQEMLERQVKDAAAALDGYDWFGVGRGNGRSRGEFVPLFWRRDHLEKLDGGHFWMSPTPDFPARAWGALVPRITTWAKFRDKRTGKSLFVFNTHIDPFSARSKVESAKLLLQRIHEIAADAPVVVTGDFNGSEKSPQYEILTGVNTPPGMPVLRDSRYVSQNPHVGPQGTWRGMGRPSKAWLRLDYVFVAGPLTVVRHETFAPLERRYPSDHLPVVTEINLD